MMLVLYFAWFHDQLATKDVAKIGNQKSNQQIAEELWAEKYQKTKETS
jgi:molybdopterin converting factor small subunit